MSAENAAKMAKAIYDIEINDAAYCEVEDIPLDDADTVRACLAGLKSSEWRAILGCAEALGKSRILHKEIISELRNLLKYEEDSVQTAAALSLCHLDVDDPNIVAAIIRLLHAKIKEETPYFCNANDLAENLGGLQRAAPVVVPAILKILESALKVMTQESSYDRLVFEFTRSLARYPAHKQTILPVLEMFLLRDFHDMAYQVMEAIIALAPDPDHFVPLVLKICHDVADKPNHYKAVRFIEYLGKWGFESQKILFEILDSPTLSKLVSDYLPFELAELVRQSKLDTAAVQKLLSYEASADPVVRKAAAQAIAGLGKNFSRSHAPKPDFVKSESTCTSGFFADGLLQLTELDVRIVAPILIHEGAFYCAFKKIIDGARAGEWETDIEKLGLIKVSMHNSTTHEAISLPMHWPRQSTGASGARRKFKLEFTLDNELVASLDQPFYDKRGWGNEHFVFSWSQEKSWFNLHRTTKESALERTRIRPEHDPALLRPLAGGQLVLWKNEDGQLAAQQDATPYFGDDWVQDDEVTEAYDNRKSAALRMYPKRLNGMIDPNGFLVLNSAPGKELCIFVGFTEAIVEKIKADTEAPHKIEILDAALNDTDVKHTVFAVLRVKMRDRRDDYTGDIRYLLLHAEVPPT